VIAIRSHKRFATREGIIRESSARQERAWVRYPPRAGHALPADEPIIFDRMWIVALAPGGTTSLLRLHYGAPISLPR